MAASFHPLRFFALAALVALAFSLAACDSGTDDDPFEYPGPGNNDAITLAELVTAPAGTYNVEAYVVDRRICPPNTECLLPDAIFVSSTPTSGEEVEIEVNNAGQFTEGAQYLLSVRVLVANSNRTYVLQGYERL